MISAADFSNKIYNAYLRGRTGLLSHGDNFFEIAERIANEPPERRDYLISNLCPRYEGMLFEYGQRTAWNECIEKHTISVRRMLKS